MWMKVDRKCPCKGCDNRLVGCHALCPEYKNWKENYERIKAENTPQAHELSRSMKKHIWRMMLGR